MLQLLQLLCAIHPMDLLSQEFLKSLLVRREFKKGEVILKEGQVCRYIYFLETGLIRIFHLDEGKEITTWILGIGEIFISALSFFTQEPASEYIVAVEDCVVWGINYQQLVEICTHYPQFLWHWVKILIKYYVFTEKVKKDLLALTPEDRYLLIQEEQPDWIIRVDRKDLASYLGMSLSLLKDIRKRISGRGRKQ